MSWTSSNTPNIERYASQRIMIVEVGDYAYIVPFIETDDLVFLKNDHPESQDDA